MAIPSYLPKQADIIACYRLEDLVDESANAYTLTNNNAVTFTAAKINNGANTGANNSTKTLYIANNFGIDGGIITICFWVKKLSNSGTEGLVSQVGSVSRVANWVYYDTATIKFGR